MERKLTTRFLLLPRAAIYSWRIFSTRSEGPSLENARVHKQTVDDSQTALEIDARSSYVPRKFTGVRFRYSGMRARTDA